MGKPLGKIDVLVFDGFIAAEAFAIVDVLHMANVLAQRRASRRRSMYRSFRSAGATFVPAQGRHSRQVLHHGAPT